MAPAPKVLVAPLDWGLGHATRCIPIIKGLLQHKCEVWIAASGPQKALLKEEFPFLSFVEIPGYGIKYDKNRAFTILRLLSFVPKILIRIKQENAWLHQVLLQVKPDVVISDNRYGLYAPGLFSVFITHQLRIRTPFGRGIDGLLQRINYSAIRRFSVCWIPDRPGADCLAGELSHPSRLPPVPLRYIGWLSRLGGVDGMGVAGEAAGGSGGISDVDLLVLLSGPEPQRTILEKKILKQAVGLTWRMVLLRGLPDGGPPAEVPAGVIVHDHLAAAQLSPLLRRARVVIARAGYSTVMELMSLGKKAVLIPTPGQTEQEYLGDYLSGRGLVVCRRQKDLSLKEAVARAETLGEDVSAHGEDAELLRSAISALMGWFTHRRPADQSLPDLG